MIYDVEQVPGPFKGKMNDAAGLLRGSGSRFVAGIGLATLQGRCGGLHGSEKRTFCIMKRSSCKHLKRAEMRDTLGPIFHIDLLIYKWMSMKI